MALAQQLGHRPIRNPALPYDSYGSPIKAGPVFISGQNVLTSLRTYIERRPGFATFEPTPTTFTGGEVPTRVFTWSRWDGTFYTMLATHSGNIHNVYKLLTSSAQGAANDASFVNLSISNNGTNTVNQPVDMIVSNNYLFMSSGDGLVKHKWNTTNVWNWGISIGGVNGPNTAGTGANAGSGTAWTNPGNVSSGVSFATVALAAHASSQQLNATNFGFSISTGTPILGIQVTCVAKSTIALNGRILAFLLKGGNIIGLPRGPVWLTTGANTLTFGGTADLWGTTWLPADISASTFGVALIATDTDGNSITVSVNNVQISVYTSAVTATPTGSGSLAAVYGWQYVYCYGNSITGHVSSPSVISASTGAFSGKASVGVTLTASPDAQVNQIRVFRTTDGGGGIFYEISNSPFPNTTATVQDTTIDANLSTITAPIPGYNDPPPNDLVGMTWFQNRLWGIKQNTNIVAFSGWEEINIGVEEECWPSGPAGNYYYFDGLVTGVDSTTDFLFIFTDVSIQKIQGDSLDTFYRSYLARAMGCRSRQNVDVLGRMIAWLNIDSTVWTSDGYAMQEISLPIRNDIKNIDHTQSNLQFFKSGLYQWLTLWDGANNRVFVYDLDTQQWIPPWVFSFTLLSPLASGSSNVGAVIGAGETSVGVSTLLACSNAAQLLAMTPTAYLDAGATYASNVQTNLFDLVPGNIEITTGGYTMGAPGGHLGEPEYVALETNAVMASTVQFLTDDDPFLGVYSEPLTPVDPPLRQIAVNANLIEKWYYQRIPGSRRASLKISWAAANSNFKLYSADIAYRVML